MFKCLKNVIWEQFIIFFLYFVNYTLECLREFYLQITKPQVNPNEIHHQICCYFISHFSIVGIEPNDLVSMEESKMFQLFQDANLALFLISTSMLLLFVTWKIDMADVTLSLTMYRYSSLRVQFNRFQVIVILFLSVPDAIRSSIMGNGTKRLAKRRTYGTMAPPTHTHADKP